MAHLMHIEDVWLATFWIPAIEHGDTTGLTEEEVEQLDSFLEDFENCTFEYCYDYPEFEQDAVSGYMADCVLAKVFKLSVRN